jgi:hypothetical protein
LTLGLLVFAVSFFTVPNHQTQVIPVARWQLWISGTVLAPRHHVLSCDSYYFLQILFQRVCIFQSTTAHKPDWLKVVGPFGILDF